MKSKFKLNDKTTLDDIENELVELCKANVVELHFDYIAKIALFLGCELTKSPPGSQERFKHELISSYGGYFGVHLIHGRKVKMINKANYKKYLYPSLIEIIKKKKNQS